MNNNSSKQVLLSVIGVAILVVAVVGVSFAFFNYSRTSTNTNTLTTGTIFFESDDTGFGTGLNNAFPISAAAAATETCNSANVGCATVTIGGNTTYGQGIDFQVEFANVTTTGLDADMVDALTFIVDPGTLPTGITVTPTSAITLANGNTVLTGTIAGTTATTKVQAVITIKAYYDSSKIFISDTQTDPHTIDRADERPMVTTTEWNNKSVSFGIRVNADQGGYVAS